MRGGKDKCMKTDQMQRSHEDRTIAEGKGRGMFDCCYADYVKVGVAPRRTVVITEQATCAFLLRAGLQPVFEIKFPQSSIYLATKTAGKISASAQ